MVKSQYIPHRGDIVWVNFSPRSGREQGGKRPAFVVSPRKYNERSGLALLCPITSKTKGYPFEVVCTTDKVKGVVLVDQIRSIDWQERHVSFATRFTGGTLREIQQKAILLIEGEY
jgi:mRNA interferase MazF